jgi:NADH-quinone oxidoreductase subunit M
VGAVAVTAIVLAALYILGPYQRIFTGARPEQDPTPDLDRREIGVLAPLLVALLVFGFVPGPLLDLANPVSQSLVTAHGGSAR